LIGPLARERSIGISAASPDSKTYVPADRQRFKQVLPNSADQCREITQPASSLAKRSALITVREGVVLVRINDTGPGIATKIVLATPFDRLGCRALRC